MRQLAFARQKHSESVEFCYSRLDRAKDLKGSIPPDIEIHEALRELSKTICPIFSGQHCSKIRNVRKAVMKEKGKIIAVERGDIVVEVSPPEACSKCCSCSGSTKRTLRVKDEIPHRFQKGDIVTVDVETRPMMRIYMMVYALPLIIFTGTLLIFHALTSSPLYSFAAGLAATALFYIFLRGVIAKGLLIVPSVHLEKTHELISSESISCPRDAR